MSDNQEVLLQVLREIIATNSDKPNLNLNQHQKQVLGIKEHRRFETCTINGKTVLFPTAPKIKKEYFSE